MHMWRLQPGCFLMAGLANMGASGYIPVFRISPPSGMPPKSRKDRNKLKSEWAAIPEFYEFIKAERFLANAVFAMSHKNTRTRCSSSKSGGSGQPQRILGTGPPVQAGTRRSGKNMRLADEYTRKSALSGFARAAMKFGKTWDQFCKSQDFTEAEAREWQTGIFAPPEPATPPSNTTWESSACTDSAWKKPRNCPGMAGKGSLPGPCTGQSGIKSIARCRDR